MATVATAPASRLVTTGAYDRVFYSGLALSMALVVFAGFAPTYYLRAFGDPPLTVSGRATLSPLAHVHGALFTAWVLLFIVQTSLIAGRRTKVHMRLGIAFALIAAAMVPVGIGTAIRSAASGGAPPGVDPLAFLAIPLFDMVLFPLFVAAALRARRNKEAHKRLMLLAYTSIITAAVARLPGVLPYGPLLFFALSLIPVLLGIAYDIATRRTVHPVYVWGGLLLVVSVPLRLFVSGTASWMTIARFLTS